MGKLIGEFIGQRIGLRYISDTVPRVGDYCRVNSINRNIFTDILQEVRMNEGVGKLGNCMIEMKTIFREYCQATGTLIRDLIGPGNGIGTITDTVPGFGDFRRRHGFSTHTYSQILDCIRRQRQEGINENWAGEDEDDAYDITTDEDEDYPYDVTTDEEEDVEDEDVEEEDEDEANQDHGHNLFDDADAEDDAVEVDGAEVNGDDVVGGDNALGRVAATFGRELGRVAATFGLELGRVAATFVREVMKLVFIFFVKVITIIANIIAERFSIE
jgi:hypothetical protein